MIRLRALLYIVIPLLVTFNAATVFHSSSGSMFAQEEADSWEKIYGTDESGAYKKLPSNPKDACETATSNIERAAQAILGEKKASSRNPRTAWDHASEPKYFKQVNDRLLLKKKERAILYRNGFVVLPKTELDNYGYAYHEIYQSELPVYITIDSIMHAIYISNDEILKDLELKILEPALNKAVEAMRARLATQGASLPADMLRDLDVYLTVAASLLKGSVLPSQFRTDSEVNALYGMAMEAKDIKTVSLFGRMRKIDWSQYTPRGHYADEDFQKYFRGAMWLSRTEFNLSSRSCMSSFPGDAPDPSETPREVLAALALSGLAESSGAAGDIALVGRAWDLLAGVREDLSLRDVAEIQKSAAITNLDADAAVRFIKALGGRFARTVNTHPMPDGTKELPAICTMIGPRITSDTGALKNVHDPAVKERKLVSVCDMGYALGSDRAKNYLAADLARYPELSSALDSARKTANTAKDAGDLYAAWMSAIRKMGAKVEGVLPSVMEHQAYEDLRLNGIVAAFGQIKHNYVLMAAQDYFFGGCRIPDGFVEPLTAVYAALMDYAARGAKVLAAIDPEGRTKSLAYFQRTLKTLSVLKAISERELANSPLSDEMKSFLSMIAELEPGTTGGPPVYSGWFFDLFYTRADGLSGAAFIADYFTSPEPGKIGYAGVSSVSFGVFVVDTCGAPRLFVGPVPRAFEYIGPINSRLTDAAAPTLTGVKNPWAESYTAPAHRAPSLRVSLNPVGDGKIECDVETTEPSGLLRIVLLDHNRKPLAQKNMKLKPGSRHITIGTPLKGKSPEAVYLGLGRWEHWSELNFMGTYLEFGGMKTQE
jgi:hypothetical protein